ncbi:ATP-binding protein, partial [Shimia sp.]|uniref:sensor histidine kinase n=1 Tax=Shimia sp. TaxID=1954381 RepID=UPI003561EC58
LDADAPILGQQEFLNRVHPEDLKIVEAADTALISGQKSKSKSVFRIRHEDGHWVWVQSDTGVSARDAEGRPTEISGAHTDITAEKVARNKSLADSFRYKVLMEKSPAGAAVFGLDASLLECNRAFGRYLGYSRSEIIGMKLHKLVWFDNDPAEVQKKLDFYQGKTSEISFESVMICKDGRRKHAMISGTRLTNLDEQDTFLFQLLDITDKVISQKQKDMFLATISHELRTPLTTITGAVKLLNGGQIGALPEGAGHLLELAEKGVGRMTHLIDRLLVFKSLESGEVSYHLEPLDPLEIIEAVSATVELKEGQSFEYADAAASAPILVDGTHVQQVLIELLTNASKFSPQGAKITVSLAQEDDAVTISVSDEGEGVPEAFLEKLFGHFNQADSSDVRSVGGAGLGLALAKRMTEGMGGSIGYTAAASGGATFWIRFPIAPVAADQGAAG